MTKRLASKQLPPPRGEVVAFEYGSGTRTGYYDAGRWFCYSDKTNRFHEANAPISWRYIEA